ncbi:hypothetical protein D0N50_22760 (plasmid) [Erwinia billingiae]|uniref:DUF5983 family protein n=1 Tax=Erwinia billingiae TaxID=182337 RepID=UPI001248000C|nr:hypothetical protein [Erwinia billingiae]QEW34567.1 hypothetical protein D0N50_22760 [Erwinia billingiae]
MDEKKMRVLTCSMNNITRCDAIILAKLSEAQAGNVPERWVINIFFGFMVIPEKLAIPAMSMRNAGLSEDAIRLLTDAREINGADVVIIDRDAKPLEGWPLQSW